MRKSESTWMWRGWPYSLLWAILPLIYLAMSVPHLEAYAWDYDEGPQIQAAALASLGFRLYSEVALNKPPLLTWILRAAFSIGGTNLPTARATLLLLNGLGFAALGLLAEEWWGRWAGPTAMALYLLLPDVAVRAPVVMNDLPSMMAILLSFLSATRFKKRGKWCWLFIAAGSYTAAIGFHPIVAPLIVPLLYILLGGKPNYPTKKRRTVSVAGGFCLCVATLALLMILAVGWSDLPDMARWVVTYNTLPVPPSAKAIRQALSPRYLAVLLIGSLGFAYLYRAEPENRDILFASGLWFLLASLTIIIGPFREHYFIFPLYPLVITAGGGASTLILRSVQQKGARAARRWEYTGLALGICLVLWAIGYTLYSPRWPTWSPERTAARTFLRASTEDEEFIVSDDPFLVFSAGRVVPPPLADTSQKRIRAGWLDTRFVAGNILRYQARYVVFATNRFNRIDGLQEWVQRATKDRASFGRIHIYHLDLLYPSAEPADIQIGEGIRLAGYAVPKPDLRAGETLTVTLLWQCTEIGNEELIVFVHLMDSGQRLIVQHDGPPLWGWYPTTWCSPGVVISDPHPLQLPGALAEGTYLIWVGMYHWPSLERLPAFRPDGSRWPDDRILLTEIDITAP